jgi:hypothetical protein
MTQRINSAVKALATDDSLLAKFRQDPAAVLLDFELLECELEAVKSGDEGMLLAHGLDPELIFGRPSPPHWIAGLVGTVSRRLAVPALIAVLLALAVQGSGIQTASAARASFRARRQIHGVRTLGPAGLRREGSRVGARARARVRSVQKRISTRARYKNGLIKAQGNVGKCVKCSTAPPSDGSK